jgi:hypothetical protein
MEKMTIKEILAVDLANNYPGEVDKLDAYYAGAMLFDAEGQIKKIGNSLFTVIPKGDVVEWHPANADNWTKFASNVQVFLSCMSKEGFKKAETYFDNLKLMNIYKWLGVSYTVEKIDDGKYRTYRAEVVL